MEPFYESKPDSVYIDVVENLNFPAHLHGLIEMIYVLRGEIQTWIDGTGISLKRGEAGVIFPHCVHSYESAESSCILLRFPASVLGGAAFIVQVKRPAFPALRAEQVTQAVRKDFFEMKSLRGQDKKYLPEALAQLLFIRVLAELTLVPVQSSDTQELTARAIVYISKHYMEGIRQSEVALCLHVSKSHLSRVLKSTLNRNFCEYVNCLRVENAKSLLKTTRLSVVDIAMESGFESLRSFNRAFLAVTGRNPRTYRAE